MQERIHGTVMPVLELTLDPGERIVAESGELSWMTESMTLTTSTQGAGGQGVFGALKRTLSGGTFFMTSYTPVNHPGMISFAAHLPGQIFPVDVSPQPGSGFMVHRHGYVCGHPTVALTVGFQQRLGAGVFGGEGFVLQRLSGEGRAWVQLSGEVITYDLAPGQVMRVHPGHVGMFQDTVQFGITTIPGIRNKLFGGDGLFLAALTGPGRIWLQSLPIDRLAHALQPFLSSTSSNSDSRQSGIGGALFGNS